MLISTKGVILIYIPYVLNKVEVVSFTVSFKKVSHFFPKIPFARVYNILFYIK